jgi:hypothetical protein
VLTFQAWLDSQKQSSSSPDDFEQTERAAAIFAGSTVLS